MTPRRTPTPRPSADGPADGYTLVEAMIAMTLVVLLTGFALAMYLFAARAVGRWQHRVGLEDATHVVTRRLAADVLAARRVVITAPDSLTLWRDAGDSLSYALRDTVLVRDGIPLHAADLVATRFRAHALSAMGDTLRGVVDSRTRPVALVVMEVALADGTLRFPLQVRVAPRVSAGWYLPEGGIPPLPSGPPPPKGADMGLTSRSR